MNSNKTNESNTIDELFQRKLGNYTVEPSAEARERFLTQINKKKVRPIWFFSAAASTIFLCGLGWFLYTASFDAALSPEVAASTKATSPLELPKEDASIAKTSDEIKINTEQKVSLLASDRKVKIAPSKATIIKTPLKNSSPSEAKIETLPQTPERSITGVLEMDEPIQDVLTLALLESEQQKSVARKEEVSEDKSLFQKGVGQTIIIVTSDIPKKGDEEIFIPGVNSHSPITLSEATDLGNAIIEEDRSFIAKVFTELKHLKHGEKVDINTLTVSNTTDINADETFFSHETEQLRERFRWFKGKVSRE